MEDFNHITKLRLGNYEQWKLQVTALLRGEDVLEHVEKYVAEPDNCTSKKWIEWSTKRDKAMTILTSTITDYYLTYVKECTSPCMVWSLLYDLHNFGICEIFRIIFNIKDFNLITKLKLGYCEQWKLQITALLRADDELQCIKRYGEDMWLWGKYVAEPDDCKKWIEWLTKMNKAEAKRNKAMAILTSAIDDDYYLSHVKDYTSPWSGWWLHLENWCKHYRSGIPLKYNIKH